MAAKKKAGIRQWRTRLERARENPELVIKATEIQIARMTKLDNDLTVSKQAVEARLAELQAKKAEQEAKKAAKS